MESEHQPKSIEQQYESVVRLDKNCRKSRKEKEKEKQSKIENEEREEKKRMNGENLRK